jgi:hypothetical protein
VALEFYEELLMNEIHNLLDQLSKTYEKKSHHVVQSLIDSVTASDLEKQCEQWFPSKVPESVVMLYSWKGGQAKDAWEEKFPFWFRDMSFISFISLEQAKFEYESMMSSYGVDNLLEEDGIELRFSFPFAAFNGGWFVVPSSTHQWSDKYPEPVICVMQGINLYFHSVEIMLKTCNEWVAHPNYSSDESELNEDIEMSIWKKHNPSIFED